MARQEVDREDLLAEASALVERIELSIAGYDEPVVCGFRSSACVSLFFGADPAYQFNSQSQLRRAFVAGQLYKAERGRIVPITRSRLGDRIVLERGDLDGIAHAQFLQQAAAHVAALRGAIEAGRATVVRHVPAGSPVPARLRDWLAALDDPIIVAASPHAR